jgi:hypothetical protein
LAETNWTFSTLPNPYLCLDRAFKCDDYLPTQKEGACVNKVIMVVVVDKAKKEVVFEETVVAANAEEAKWVKCELAKVLAANELTYENAYVICKEIGAF